MNSYMGRAIGTVLAFIAYWAVNVLYAPQATLSVGRAAGKQFENSDGGYVDATYWTNFVSGIGGLLSLLLLLAIVMIWWSPVKRWLATLAVAGLAFAAFQPHPASAYYDKQDWAESYFILPNESAFFIPDVGANKNSQAAFGSEEYLKENKIAAKRFNVPHVKLENSGLWSNFYVPAGRLIIVDRTPFSREWVSQEHRGTSRKDESFPCQSKEGLNIGVGMSIGASLLEENSPRFLHRFGVKPPVGDRKQPEVIFNSVFYGASLIEAMDGPVRSNIQAMVCEEFTMRSFEEGNEQAAQIRKIVESKIKVYLTSIGPTLDFIGWADTFTFDRDIQKAINDRYTAEKIAPVLPTLERMAAIRLQEGLADGLKTKGLPANFVAIPDSWGSMLSGLLKGDAAKK